MEEDMDFGLFLLRVVFGVLLMGHGTQKLFGWFGGYGLDGTGGFFDSLGFRPGRPMAAVAGVSEVGGGLLLALGLFTPLAGAVIVGTLFVAGSVHLDKGLWTTNGGYELALLYGVLGAALAVAGPGAASVDHLVGLDDTWNTGLGLVAIAVGLLSGATVVARARWTLRRESLAAETATEATRNPATAA
jgi:putative oxidoreductase